MWPLRVEESIYLSLKMERDALKPSVFYPVMSSILSEGKAFDTVLVETLVESKQDTETYFRENSMCGLWADVKASKAFAGGREAARNKELFNGEMGKLYNTGAV
jgi:hypothetical protein